jgi:phenylacetate-CoA ligase
VIDPETRAPAAPGQIGTIVATPFAPYRQTTLLLRYDTEDLVRRLAQPPTCALAHLPATGPLLGKRRLAVRHAHGWTTPRDVLESLEALDEVPLPARCAFWAVPGGVTVEVVAREDTAETRHVIERALEAHGVPVRDLRLVTDRGRLGRMLPWRCDLREATFEGITSGTADPPPLFDRAASLNEPALSLTGSVSWS